jgi:hypothetical protein
MTMTMEPAKTTANRIVAFAGMTTAMKPAKTTANRIPAFAGMTTAMEPAKKRGLSCGVFAGGSSRGAEGNAVYVNIGPKIVDPGRPMFGDRPFPPGRAE